MESSNLPADFFDNIPRVSTTSALLVLDIQNDFVSPDGALFVPSSLSFVNRLPALAAHFRQTGKVFWVQTLFQQQRGTFSQAAGGNVIFVNPPSSSAAVDPEAFLSGQPAKRCCLPDTTGAQFPPSILSAIDNNVDTVLVKSDYSAFQSHTVLFTFRAQFITELYICGSLTNVSIYATVLDAVRNGFTVTLIDDCLGFRRFAKHRDAREHMTDALGVYTVTSGELLKTEKQPELVGEALVGEIGSANQQDSIEVDGACSEPVEPSSPLLSRALRRLRTDDREDGSSRPKKEPEEGSRRTSRRKKAKPTIITALGPGDSIGSGDSKIVYDLPLPDTCFQSLRKEVAWQKMYHMSGQVPRLVAVQGEAQADGSIPIYRHPADESPPLFPFTDTVDTIRRTVEKYLRHPLNHVLIQLYRNGEDRISEHSDKTLDIVRGSSICNVSLGAQRTMTLRTKASAKGEAGPKDDGRSSQRIPMPHNSLFVLGETTNMKWLHGIRPDKRPESEKLPEELAYNGERISLTFRQIGTFIDPKSDTIWGQGARSKLELDAGKIIHGDKEETERMIRAFGQENQQTVFDWNAEYGAGFDVVNFLTVSHSAKVVLSGEPVFDLRVLLCLVENGIRYDVVDSIGDLPPPVKLSPEEPPPIYLDSDGKTYISGDIDILSHIGSHRRAPDTPNITTSSLRQRFAAANGLLEIWRSMTQSTFTTTSEASSSVPESLAIHLKSLESLVPPGRNYISAPSAFGIDDCVVWPVLWFMARHETGQTILGKFPTLFTYYGKVGRRACVKGVLEEITTES